MDDVFLTFARDMASIIKTWHQEKTRITFTTYTDAQRLIELRRVCRHARRALRAKRQRALTMLDAVSGSLADG